MKEIRAITLDLDDTLWPIDPVIEAAEARVYDWLCENCPDIGRSHSIESLREARLDIARLESGIAHDVTELRRRSLRAILVDDGSYPETYVDQAMEVFLEHRNRVALFPDARPFLERASRKYPLVSLSNGNADLQRIGLGDLFTAQVAAGEVGAAKPDPQIFRAACERLALQPRQVLHIGDHPEHDILGAARAGIRTVWINRNGAQWDGAARADHEVTDLEQVLDLLPLPRPGDPE
ncbi:MAG TPA: HAD family hydrolase [Arenicellales bacterium]|nr:HAD family hydrolase [Arenicellales bacterium]